MATLVATPDPTTGTIRVDVEQTQLRDLFTRVVANAWGNATTGQAWLTAGGAAAEYAVNGTRGTMTFSSVVASRRASATLGIPNMGFSIEVTIAVDALTAPIQPGVMIRHTNGNNFYLAELSLLPSGTAELRIRKVVLGVISTIGTETLRQTHTAGATWVIMADICGSTIRAKAWRPTVSEPGWVIEAKDFDLATGDNAGAHSVLASGNTNGVTVFAYDNAVAWISQPVRLYRVTSDGVRTEVRGSPGYTENPTAAENTAFATFYDNEAPFDTDVFYELTSNCSSTVVVTSNTVSLDSGGDGWLRDPIDPTKNLRIVMEDFFDECVDEDVIVFSGLAAREYENASGIFDHIDARRPLTVSMTRKNYASVLTLTSFSLDDVDGLEDIFDPGRILSLSLPMQYGWAHRTYGTDYITCFDITQSLIGVDQRLTTRVWTIPFHLSPEPVDTSEGRVGGNGIGGGDATYDVLAASVIGTTYNSLTAAALTYTLIARGTGY